jgi:hypothetical protein
VRTRPVTSGAVGGTGSRLNRRPRSSQATSRGQHDRVGVERPQQPPGQQLLHGRAGGVDRDGPFGVADGAGGRPEQPVQHRPDGRVAAASAALDLLGGQRPRRGCGQPPG